jgi:hypothetical protein
MNYLPITGIIFIFGFVFVKRLSHMIYYSNRYTKALDQKFNYDEVVVDKEIKMEIDEKADDEER